MECGRVTADGKFGDCDHTGQYYCNECWSLWDAGIRGTQDGGDMEVIASLQMLLDMGYDTVDAEDALRRAQGDVELAVALLCEVFGGTSGPGKPAAIPMPTHLSQ